VSPLRLHIQILAVSKTHIGIEFIKRYATWRHFFERKVNKTDKCIKKHTSNIFLEETLEKISKE
jgi:hypothetical protein